ncbi:TPR domain protein [Plectosphaerella plurivora]|uniref:TPR domain protein n=1 Tax=Plectosphaerella plurivora TaxID=936078 RepID=A0A9P8VCM0_9PEZI|nr:TPR domain protein [Plectosphaerella plurivora]
MADCELGSDSDTDSSNISDLDAAMNHPDIDLEDFMTLSLMKGKENKPKPHQRDGEVVKDHTAVDVLVSQFNAKLALSSSSLILQPSHHPHHGSMVISRMPAPYAPCVRSIDNLDPIAIADMRLETHHRGKKTAVHVLTLGHRQEDSTVTGIVEDEAGTAITLLLDYQPEETVVPANEILRPGNVFVIKEPFFEANTTGTYCLRVDHLNDIVRLDWKHEDLIPTKWKRHPETQTSSELRDKGNQAVKGERWAEAHRLYTSAIHATDSPEDQNLAYLNRSLASLRLGRPHEALLDAQKAGEILAPSERSLFRESRALYALGDFAKALEKLEAIKTSFSATMSPQIRVEIERAKTRLHEQRTGEYDFKRMYKQAEKTPPVIDCANYTIVEIRPSPGRGKGVFTNVPVKAGQILLCEKALAYVFVDEFTPGTVAYRVHEPSGEHKGSIGGIARIISQSLQKMHNDPKAKAVFDGLYRGDETWGPFGFEVDGHPVTHSFQAHAVVGLNGFAVSRTLLEARRKKKQAKNLMRIRFGSTGIWTMVSCINHSCYINCQRGYIGDMQIVRAARDLPAGAELFLDYAPALLFQSYDSVQRNLAQHEFKCTCELCEMKMKTSAYSLQRRQALHNEFQQMLFGNRAADAYHIPAMQRMNVNRAEQIIELMTRTFPEGPVRMELFQPYTMLAGVLLTHHKPEEAVKLIAQGLRAVDFEVTARLRPRPVFRIIRWGYVFEDLPMTLMTLFVAYRCVGATAVCDEVRRYARVAYSIHMGEGDTMEQQCEEFAHPY